MKDQNTPTNTQGEQVITTFYGVDVKKLTTEDCEAIHAHSETRLSQAVNKAEKKLAEEIIKGRPTNATVYLARLDQKLYELNKTNTYMEGNETPKGDK